MVQKKFGPKNWSKKLLVLMLVITVQDLPPKSEGIITTCVVKTKILNQRVQITRLDSRWVGLGPHFPSK